MNNISRIFWRGVSVVAFILLSQFLYYRDLDVPADWSRWLSSDQATYLLFTSLFLLLTYLLIVLVLTPDDTE